MQFRMIGAAAAIAGFAALVVPAFAANINYRSALAGTKEVPANTSAGTGTLTAIYGTVGKRLVGTVTYTGLTGEATGAHFHGPATNAETAGVVIPITGPLVSPIRFNIVLTDEQAAILQAAGTEAAGKRLYFNIHTAANPGGEIRGQVMAAP